MATSLVRPSPLLRPNSRVWFTLSQGIVNEIYFPDVDSPNTCDLQFLITNGESFCHEERRDLLHQTEYPEQNSLLYRLTNSDREGRYRLVKEIVVDPHSSVLLMYTRLEILDPTLRGKLHLYALLAPHMKGTGKNNSAWWHESNGRKLFHVQREDIHMSFCCAAEFARNRKENLVVDFLLDYADWLSTHLEEWTVTNRGELVKGKPRHYIRITPVDPKQAVAAPDPDNAEIFIANDGRHYYQARVWRTVPACEVFTLSGS